MDLDKLDNAEFLLGERREIKRNLDIFKKEGAESMVVGNLHFDTFSQFRFREDMHNECIEIVSKYLNKALEQVEKDISEL